MKAVQKHLVHIGGIYAAVVVTVHEFRSIYPAQLLHCPHFQQVVAVLVPVLVKSCICLYRGEDDYPCFRESFHKSLQTPSHSSSEPEGIICGQIRVRMPSGVTLSPEDFLHSWLALLCQPVIGAVRKNNDIRDEIRLLCKEFLYMDHSAVVVPCLDRRMAAVAYSGETGVTVVLGDTFRPDTPSPHGTSNRAVIEAAEPEGIPDPECPAVPGGCDAVAEDRQFLAAEGFCAGRCLRVGKCCLIGDHFRRQIIRCLYLQTAYFCSYRQQKCRNKYFPTHNRPIFTGTTDSQNRFRGTQKQIYLTATETRESAQP